MRSELAEKVLSKKLKDYSYAVVFFLLASFFIYFAIRPNIMTAISLRKELVELQKLNDNYEQAIEHVVNVQTILERYRDDYHLLSEALPATPQVNKVVDDIYTVATNAGMLLNQVNIEEVNLKEIEDKKLRQYNVDLGTESKFENVKAFFDGLNQQRRLKTIDDLSITKSGTASESSDLRIQFKITGYYL